ncbi:hypothetical protein ES705_45902 [subsurface metagenome]
MNLNTSKKKIRGFIYPKLDIEIMSFFSSTRTENRATDGFAVVFFSDKGFELFATDITDSKLITNLIHYPALMGMLQNQKPEGLATTKIQKNLFLFAYVIFTKNLEAKDPRLHQSTMTVINFLVCREIYQLLMLRFDELEDFLENYFYPIAFIEDLYALDFTQIIPQFLDQQNKKQEFVLKNVHENVPESREHSLALEFKRWLKKIKFNP